MKNKRWLTALKWLWTIAIVAGVVYYFARNYQANLAIIRSVAPLQFLLSAALLVVGKLFLAEMSRQSVISDVWKPGYGKMLHLYSTIQLSKYLPGGVWHFVGRFGVYRLNGLDNRQATQSMIVENIWLVSSAFLFGGVVCLASPTFLALLRLPAGVLQLLLPLACAMLWVVGNTLIARYVLRRAAGPGAILRQIAVQAAVWLFIGLSFFALLPARSINADTAALSTGGFAIGWALGYVTIFAPSGIGIREAVITAILSASIQAPEAAVYAALSRLVWIVTEISLSIVTELKYGSGSLKTLFRPRNDDHPA